MIGNEDRGRNRAREVEALRLMDICLAERHELQFRLDAFGDHHQPRRLQQCRNVVESIRMRDLWADLRY